jgi:hypothetical protein
LAFPPPRLLAQPILFVDRSNEAGLTGMMTSSGIAVADYNADGWDDIAVTQSIGPVALFRNNRDGTFSNVAVEAGLGGRESGVHPLWGDLNNDGHPDLLLAESLPGGATSLFYSNGDGTFADRSQDSGISPNLSWAAGAYGDYDGDGLLDLYISTLTRLDKLYRNLGEDSSPVFMDVTDEAGIVGDPDYRGMQVSWIDYNQDSFLDIFVVNDEQDPSLLFENQGDGSFLEVAERAGIREVGRGNSMGVAWGDFDHNGWQDVVVTRISETGLFMNNGDATFEDLTAPDVLPFEGVGWGALAEDFDNDGDEDVLLSVNNVVTGSLLFENDAGSFEDITALLGDVLRIPSVSSASGDFNNDGFVDVVLSSGGELRLLMNEPLNESSWIALRLAGNPSNRLGIGALVRVVAGGHSYLRTVMGGSSWQAQVSPRLHVGLGSTTVVDSIEVFWGHRSRSVHLDLAANQTYTLQEDGGVVTDLEQDASPALPDRIDLVSTYPNPFSGSTEIAFVLDAAAEVRVEVFSILGNKVAEPVAGRFTSGRHTARFEAKGLPSGIYLCRLTTGHVVRTKSMILQQ